MRLLYMIQVCACIVFTYRCHYMSIFMFYIGSFQVFKEFVSCMCPFWANRTRGLIYLAFWFSLFCLGEIAMNYMCSLTLSLMSITIVWNFHRQAVKFIAIHQNQTNYSLFTVLPCLFFRKKTLKLKKCSFCSMLHKFRIHLWYVAILFLKVLRTI